jgi:hypothetical protein
MEWFYHNASVVNVTENNLKNGILKQVPKAKRFGNRWHAIQYGWSVG